jgi:hypothetical protein
MILEGFLATGFGGAFCAALVGSGAARPQIGFALLITKGFVIFAEDAGAVGVGAVPAELALLVGLNFGTGGLVIGARAAMVAAFFIGAGGRARLVDTALPTSFVEADESTLEGGLL